MCVWLFLKVIIFISLFGFLKRALPIRILSVGKKRSRGLQLMVDEYVEKIKYYCSVEDVLIRSNPRNARSVSLLFQLLHFVEFFKDDRFIGYTMLSNEK
jgi:hypothetical protein